MAFDLLALRRELSELREALPSYVSDVGELTSPKLVCDEEGKLCEVLEGQGPWDLDLCVHGLEGDEAYGGPCRAPRALYEAFWPHFCKVRLRFERDLWPAKLPLVRFRGVFHHALLDDNGAMLMPFYRALPRRGHLVAWRI